jgi:hypothetical protein
VSGCPPSLYTEAERAALAYTEAATELPSGVSDEVWDAVTAAFKPEEVAYLVGQVAMINAWNRVAAPSHTPPAQRDWSTEVGADAEWVALGTSGVMWHDFASECR